MLPGFTGSQMMAAAGGSGGKSYEEILVTDLALSSGLQLILDAGDINSYAGSGNWLDRSGGANNFQPVTGASGADPVLQGVAGGLSGAEYFKGDNTRFATFSETSSGQTFLQPFHQNNAVGTIFATVYLPDPSGVASDAAISIIYDAEINTQIGINLGLIYIAGFGWCIGFNVYKGSGSASYSVGLSPFASMQIGWNTIAFAFNEASNVYTAFVNGSAQTGACTYTTPSATAASSIANAIGEVSGTNVLNDIGIGSLFVWNNYKAEAALDSIHAAIKADRLPTLP
jgi:hypothetical protein